MCRCHIDCVHCFYMLRYIFILKIFLKLHDVITYKTRLRINALLEEANFLNLIFCFYNMTHVMHLCIYPFSCIFFYGFNHFGYNFFMRKLIWWIKKIRIRRMLKKSVMNLWFHSKIFKNIISSINDYCMIPRGAQGNICIFPE